jgi:hypothetical protein
MSMTTCHTFFFLDGFVAGPEQSRDNPLGIGGLRLREWHFRAGEPGHEVNVGARDDLLRRRGAYVMGRNMFGPSEANGTRTGADGGETSRPITHVRYRVRH